jgi:uncharacterized protein
MKRNALLCTLALLGAASVSADDVRILTWEDLLPEAALEPQTQPVIPGHDPFAMGGTEADREYAEDDYWSYGPRYPAGVVDELNARAVKLPGFIVPLELESDGKISEFLLVPYFGACIHFPPPPPNQTVYVRLEKPFELESMWEPVWVSGTMETKSFQSDLAAAGYTLQATKIEEYEY